MEFGIHNSLYWHHANDTEAMFPHISAKLDPLEFHKRLRRQFAQTSKTMGDPPPILQHVIDTEVSWFTNGQPEYRIFPDAALAFGITNIDIDAKFLRLPWRSFVITFPRWLVVSIEGVEIKSLMVTETMEPKLSPTARQGRWTDTLEFPADAPCDQRKLVITMPHGSFDELLTFKLSLTPGTTIKDEFERYIWDERKGTGPKEALWLLSIVVCTCFFAVGRNSQSRMQIEPRFVRERGGGARRVYEMGREFVLPVYDDAGPGVAHRSADGEGTGRTTRPHPRRGHLRWQPYPSTGDYELIFIPPTFVGEGKAEKLQPVSIKLHQASQ